MTILVIIEVPEPGTAPVSAPRAKGRAIMMVTSVEVGRILTRTSGYLQGITSHSIQPYRGCSLGSSLCGVACYVQHNRYVTRGRPWGGFLEVRTNAAESYMEGWESERKWARNQRGCFSIFLSSATDPFLPQEFRYRITRQILLRMLEFPPDELILQTHTHQITRYLDLLGRLKQGFPLRVHISIESDRDRFPGLPPPASSVADRIQALSRLREAGIFVVATLAPLLPIQHPVHFFHELAAVSDAVIIDHYIGGDGTEGGWRTQNTRLPAVISCVDPAANSLAYRDRMVELARRIMPGRVGVGREGFAGEYR